MIIQLTQNFPGKLIFIENHKTSFEIKDKLLKTWRLGKTGHQQNGTDRYALMTHTYDSGKYQDNLSKRINMSFYNVKVYILICF